MNWRFSLTRLTPLKPSKKVLDRLLTFDFVTGQNAQNVALPNLFLSLLPDRTVKAAQPILINVNANI